MARAEALPAINLPCGAVPIHCHSQHGRTSSPITIGLALLEEVRPQPACRHLGGLSEALNSGKGTDAVQQEVHCGGHRIGDVPVLHTVDEELIGEKGDAQQGKGDQNCRRCWHCVAAANVADGSIIQDCMTHNDAW